MSLQKKREEEVRRLPPAGDLQHVRLAGGWWLMAGTGLF
jgi:hypothetical protein